MLWEKDISFSENIFFLHILLDQHIIRGIFSKVTLKKNDLFQQRVRVLARLISLSVYFATTLYHPRSARFVIAFINLFKVRNEKERVGVN